MTHLNRLLASFALAAFLLGSHKGYLALWKEDRPDPYQIFPIKTETFSESDQLALEKGIPARSELELAGLLEDFLS